MMIFHKNLRKIAEIIKNFVAKILKICLKKMYTLNRYAGNKRRGAQWSQLAPAPSQSALEYCKRQTWRSDFSTSSGPARQ